MAGRLADQGYDSAITTDLSGNPDPDADGYCCPSGQVATEDPITGEVECGGFAQCYAPGNPDALCPYDHKTEFSYWFIHEYEGDSKDLCECSS